MIVLRWPTHFRVRATEWFSSAFKLLWGFILLLPYPTFDNPLFAEMGKHMSQQTWGWIGFGLGFAHLTALYINGNVRRSPHVRAFCSGVGALFWLQVCLGMLATGIITTGWAVYPGLVVMAVYNVSCAMQDARRSDDAAKSGRIGGGR